MKTVKIPTYNSPFIVIINNKAYRYTAGDTVEVPDEVAEAIEDALELEPKPKINLSKIAQIADGVLQEITANDLDGVSKITNLAFYSCKSITKVSIPNSITKIRESAFNWCRNLKSVYLPETPPSLENINAFDNIDPECVFYCKSQNSLTAYQAAELWNTLTGTYSFVVEA
jgi:hypothetical protein